VEGGVFRANCNGSCQGGISLDRGIRAPGAPDGRHTERKADFRIIRFRFVGGNTGKGGRSLLRLGQLKGTKLSSPGKLLRQGGNVQSKKPILRNGQYCCSER